MGDVLIAVRDDKLAGLLSTACQDRGAATFRALGAAQALPEISQESRGRQWTGLLLDLGYSQGKPLELIQSFRQANKDLKIVALGRNMEVKAIAALMRHGVFDFLELPPDPVELSKCLDNFLGRLGPAALENVASSDQDSQPALKHIIGQSLALQKVFDLVRKVAATDSTVMVHGESGTGKELIARAIHQLSSRSQQPLIPINCGAIPEELLEAELFGHEKGAFTNAIRTRIGRFEMAHGGSIFLDEIGDMSPKLQVKLLRVLQERQIERVGGDKIIEVDIRIITATHVDLTKAVADGRFREDLFYRLNVIPITMPPLRQRLSDVPLLVAHFLERFHRTRGSEVNAVDEQTMRKLVTYQWPGNVRELENLIERMVTLAEGPTLTVNDLPAKLLEATEGRQPAPDLPVEALSTAEPVVRGQTPRPAAPLKPVEATTSAEERDDLDFSRLMASEADSAPQSAEAPPTASSPESGWCFPPQGVDFNALVSAYEEKLIRGALAEAGGVKNKAAKLLGLNRTTLVEKMRKKGIAAEED